MTVSADLRASELRASRGVFVSTLALNLLVAAAKLFCGFLTGTLTMIADGFHSALDATSNIVGIVALTISLQPPDAGHPYGHRKFEAAAAMLISGFMFLASFQVLSEAFRRVTGAEAQQPEVGVWSYAVMIATTVINIGVSRYEHRKSIELKSQLLAADAQHTMSDIYASLTVIATLVAIQLNYPLLDAVASVAIVAVIFRAGYGIVMSHLGTLVDAAVVDPLEVERVVMAVPGVCGCDRIRSRGMQDHIFIDLHVQLPKHLSIEEAHAIASNVEESLRAAFGGTVDALVRIEQAAAVESNVVSKGVGRKEEQDRR